MISALTIPGLFIVSAGSAAGATFAAGAIAFALRASGARVAVLQPVATRCAHRREGLVSEDAELLAACADARHPLDLIAPNRYAEDLPPNLAARRAGRPVEWDAVERSDRLMRDGAELMIVRAPAGGILTPLDDEHTSLELARALEAPVVVVTRAGTSSVNDCALTISALKHAAVPIAGVVVNRYPAESASIAEESSLREIERWTRRPLLCVLPNETFKPPELPVGVVAAAAMVDWLALARGGR